jgi:hypothetical protein
VAIVKLPYFFDLPIELGPLARGLVDALVSNTTVLCRVLVVLVFHVEPILLHVIPLPHGDLARGASRKLLNSLCILIKRYLLLFDPFHEIALVLF